MSGAFGYPWITLAMAGFFFVLGILNFMPRRYEPLPEPDWLIEARLVHGEGAPPKEDWKPSRGWEIFAGLMFLLVGLMQFGRHHPEPDAFDRGFAIVMGSLFLLLALSTLISLFLPRREGPGWSERRRKRRLERRLACGRDAYADELLTILTPKPAYREALSPARQLANTILFTLAGAGLLAAGLATPR